MTNGQRRRVLLADDHPLFRRGMSSIVNAEEDLIVCGEAGSAPETLTVLRTRGCDLAVIDICLPGANGIELTKQIRAEHPQLPILVVSVHDESLYALRALRAGASGYLNKREGAETFVEALRKVLAGQFAVSPAFGEQLIYRVARSPEAPQASPLDTLSDRELEVLQLVGQCRSSQQIALDLNLSVKTVESHRLHLKEKLGFNSSPELMRFAVEWVAHQTEI